MKKGNTTYLVIIAILVAAVLYLLWSQSQSKKVSRPNPLKKKKVTVDEGKNKVYLIDGRFTHRRRELRDLEEEIARLTREMRENRRDRRRIA